MKRALLLWLGLFALAFANGALREVFLKAFIPEPWAHHLSALTAVLIFTTYLWLLWKRSGIDTYRQAWKVGGLWFVLTLFTETLVLNRWWGKLSWTEILHTYDLSQGQLWPLVLVWIGFLPAVCRRLKGSAQP